MDRKSRGFTYTYRTCAGYGSTCSLHESIFVRYALILECHLWYQCCGSLSFYAERSGAHRQREKS